MYILVLKETIKKQMDYLLTLNNDGISKYGWSKLGGECAVRFLKNYLIIRAVYVIIHSLIKQR